MRYDLKIEIKDTKFFLDFLKRAYKDGVLLDSKQKITFDKDSFVFPLCKGLTNLTARLYNEEIVDGTARFIISENEDNIEMYPCSLYCEFENNKYSFSV